MQDNYNIKICESGANKGDTSLFNKIRSSKNFQKVVAGFALLGAAYLAPMTAEAKEVKAQIEYAYSDMYKSEIKTTPDPKYGTHHPRIADNLPDRYISNKISNFDGEVYVARYSIEKDAPNKEPELVSTAKAHTLAFINPYNGELDKMTLLIETGHSQKELNFLKRQLRSSLKTKIGYDLITTKKNQLSGEIIFSSKSMRDQGNYMGYNHVKHGIIFVAMTSNESDGFNTTIHELDHIGHDLIESTQILEASARTVSFFAEVEAKEKNSNYEFSRAGKRLLPLYEKYESLDMPNDKTLSMIFLSSLFVESGIFKGYSDDPDQFKKTWLDMTKAGVIPKSLRQEGRPTNYLKNINEDDIKKAFEVSKELSVGERYQILSGKEIDRDINIEINFYDMKQRKDITINVMKVQNPEKSGFLELSQKLEEQKEKSEVSVAVVAGAMKRSDQIG